MSEARLSGILAPEFYRVHRCMKSGVDEAGVPKTHFWLKGGRGSTKSSFAAIETVLAIKRDPLVNAVVMRKIGDTMRDSVYAQILWALDILGITREFKCSHSPMEMVYRSTGQRILFRGVDNPEKIKSLKTQTGYVGLVWFEELDQFFGMAEIRSILQTLMRGGDSFRVLYTYNPPRSRDSWANREVVTPRDDRLVHTSTYLEVPRAWLGETFFAEAEALKAVNEPAYRHEYLGDPTGTGGAVFENVALREITDAEIAEFDHIYNGLDWGYFPDPWLFGRVHHDAARRTLYIFDELTAIRTNNPQTAEMVIARLTWPTGPEGKETYHRELVWCDSAEPKSISDYRDADIDARPVRKGPGSVEYGIKWLQSLDKIVIDSRRCPVAATEFTLYEYERTRDGEYCSSLPDANNHAIDMVRYAMSAAILRRYSA